MKKIEVKILNPLAISDAEKMLVAMARLTQRGEKITDMSSFEQLYEKEYSISQVSNLSELPHPTLQKFSVINIAIVGASRRFLAQITRHQNEVKFMSGSLQYSDYTDQAQFVVPYEILKADSTVNTSMRYKIAEERRGPNDANFFPLQIAYLNSCKAALKEYEELAKHVGRDAAGYAMPQGMRNVLIISATPYQWKHMISQRMCRRNTLETSYVMLLCLEALQNESVLFSANAVGCSCLSGVCKEGKMSCGNPFLNAVASDIIEQDFPLLRKET